MLFSHNYEHSPFNYSLQYYVLSSLRKNKITLIPSKVCKSQWIVVAIAINLCNSISHSKFTLIERDFWVCKQLTKFLLSHFMSIIPCFSACSIECSVIIDVMITSCVWSCCLKTYGNIFSSVIDVGHSNTVRITRITKTSISHVRSYINFYNFFFLKFQ